MRRTSSRAGSGRMSGTWKGMVWVGFWSKTSPKKFRPDRMMVSCSSSWNWWKSVTVSTVSTSPPRPGSVSMRTGPESSTRRKYQAVSDQGFTSCSQRPEISLMDHSAGPSPRKMKWSAPSNWPSPSSTISMGTGTRSSGRGSALSMGRASPPWPYRLMAVGLTEAGSSPRALSRATSTLWNPDLVVAIRNHWPSERAECAGQSYSNWAHPVAANPIRKPDNRAFRTPVNHAVKAGRGNERGRWDVRFMERVRIACCANAHRALVIACRQR